MGSKTARRKQSPLEPLLDEINQAANSGMPFLAIAMTVALPDICVSLASETGRTSGPKYKEWCAKNLGPDFSYVTPEDLWSMRCGVLHNGRFGDMKHSVARVLFALPGGANFTNCVANDAYIYSVVTFCENFTGAVMRWILKNERDRTIKTNLAHLMQYRYGGVPPYIVGTTVLG